MEASVYCAHCGALNQPGATTCFSCTRSLNEPAPIIDARRMIRGRYRLVRQLGVGGFGAVYQAEDTALGHRLVALKEMSPRGLSPQEAQEATDAFQREALLLAGFSHPSLPRIYERFEEEGRWYLVMDFIEGETLEVYLDKQGGKLPVKEALALALQLSEVLGYLHSRQPPIIFRDLKPSNIMRTPDGQVLLIDFGIARFFKPGQNKDTIAFGSPGYAAPEQYGKAQTTPRSDIFSLGAVLHQMLTGIDPSEKPFRFAPLTIPYPAGLPDLIEQMVEMEESQRPLAMDVIRRELERMPAESPTSWRADDLAATGAYISPARASTGALSATDPVMQPAGLQFWPTSQPAKKKHGKVFWGVWWQPRF
ncbi:MAG TPA: protein kinase [Ktedonobacterales bacterium]